MTYEGNLQHPGDPFDESGAIDLESLRSLVEFQLQADVHGLTILGVMGEVAKISDTERDLITRTVLQQVAGRVPVVVNVSHAGTTQVTEAARRAAQLGVVGVMVAPPPNLRNLDAVSDFCRAVAQAAPITVVVQDEPVSSGVIMPPSFLAGLGLPHIKLAGAP